jgi:hypothetical protein
MKIFSAFHAIAISLIHAPCDCAVAQWGPLQQEQ